MFGIGLIFLLTHLLLAQKAWVCWWWDPLLEVQPARSQISAVHITGLRYLVGDNEVLFFFRIINNSWNCNYNNFHRAEHSLSSTTRYFFLSVATSHFFFLFSIIKSVTDLVVYLKRLWTHTLPNHINLAWDSPFCSSQFGHSETQ